MTFYDKKDFPHPPKLPMASENFPKIRLFYTQVCVYIYIHTHTHIQSTYEQRSPTKGWNNLENRTVVDWIHVYPSISYGETYSSCDNIST